MTPTLPECFEPAEFAVKYVRIACRPDLAEFAIRPVPAIRQADSARHLTISLGSSGAIQVLLAVGMAFVGGTATGWTPRVIVLPPGASAIASAASAATVEARVVDDSELPEATALEVISHDEAGSVSPSPSSPIVAPISPNGSLPIATAEVLSLETSRDIHAPIVAATLPDVRQASTADHPPLVDLPPLREKPPVVERRRSNATPSTQLAQVPQPESRSSPPSQPSQGVETVELPQKVFSPEPEYPAELLAARVEGVVLLRVRVAVSGQVESAAVQRSSGRVAFDNAALAAVRRWRFEPTRRAGATVAIDVKVPIRFVIRDSP